MLARAVCSGSIFGRSRVFADCSSRPQAKTHVSSKCVFVFRAICAPPKRRQCNLKKPHIPLKLRSPTAVRMKSVITLSWLQSAFSKPVRIMKGKPLAQQAGCGQRAQPCSILCCLTCGQELRQQVSWSIKEQFPEPDLSGQNSAQCCHMQESIRTHRQLKARKCMRNPGQGSPELEVCLSD